MVKDEVKDIVESIRANFPVEIVIYEQVREDYAEEFDHTHNTKLRDLLCTIVVSRSGLSVWVGAFGPQGVLVKGKSLN